MEQQKNNFGQAPQQNNVVELARNKKDNLILIVTLLLVGLLLGGYGIVRLLISIGKLYKQSNGIMVAFINEAFINGIWIGIVVVLLFLGMFFIRLQRQNLLASALNVRYSNLAWLKSWSDKVAAYFAMPQLEIFVIQEPYLNAFAFGFMKPYCIVLHSAIVDKLSSEELSAVVCHEMAHIKYKHTNIMVYLAPLTSLPILGVFVGWLFGFWARRTELTADRLAVAYLGRVDYMFRALLKIHMGPDVSKHADIEGVWKQLRESNNNMNLFSQSLSKHPFLVNRVLSLYEFSQTNNIKWGSK